LSRSGAAESRRVRLAAMNQAFGTGGETGVPEIHVRRDKTGVKRASRKIDNYRMR
jgi:hypothetical protein